MSLTQSTPLHVFIKQFLEDAKGKYPNKSKSKLIELAKTTYKQKQIEEAQELDEISRKTLGNYVKAASDEIQDQVSGSSFKSGKAGDLYNKSEDTAKTSKRRKGVEIAMNKLTKEELEVEPEVSEIPTEEVVEDLDEKASEKQAQHVVQVLGDMEKVDLPTKEKHLAYLKDNLHPNDYAHIERLLTPTKTESFFEAISEDKLGDAKNILESIFAEKVSNRLKSLKEEVAIEYGKAADKGE